MNPADIGTPMSPLGAADPRRGPTSQTPWDDIPDPFSRSAPPLEPSEPPEPPSERSPTRAERTTRLQIAVVVATVWVLVFAIVLGFRPNILAPPVLVQLGVWSAVMVACLVVTVRRKADGFPLGIQALWVGLAGMAAAFIGLTGLPVDGAEVPLSVGTVRGCLVMALVFAAPPWVISSWMLRGGFINSAALRGALVGGVCGLSGGVGIHSHCVITSMSHVLVAHGGSIVLGVLAGTLLGWRFGRP